MIRAVLRADDFWADLLKQIDWYRKKAGSEVAEGYVNTVEATLQTLAKDPGTRTPAFPTLAGIGRHPVLAY